MSTNEFADVLERWRADLREVDASGPGTPERSAAVVRAEERRLEYRAGALRLQGHTDQVEARAEDTAERIKMSLVTIDEALLHLVASDEGKDDPG